MLGQIVHYAVTEADAASIDQMAPSHAKGHQFASRSPMGSYPRPGEVRPAMVVHTHGDGTADLVLFLRGTGLWLVEQALNGEPGRRGAWWPLVAAR